MRWLPGSLATPTRQPVGGVRVRADLRQGLLFCYNGATDTIIDGDLRGLAGNLPRSITASGTGIQCSGTTGTRTVSNSAAGFASPQVTIVVVGQRRDASGITTLLCKGNGGGTGFEIALSNQFGSPSTRIYSSHRNTGGTQVNFATGFVDGRADSLNGTFDTVTGRVYAIAASSPVMTQDATSDIRMGSLGGFAANVDVMFAALWVGRAFASEQVRSFSANPWQIIEQPARPLWAPVTSVTILRPNGDIATSWTPTGAATVAAAIGEVSPSDAEFAESPDLTTPQWCTLNGTLPAGGCTIRVRAQRTAAAGQVRVRLADSGGTDVGGSAWQALTGTPTTYNLAATTTAAADRFRIEVQP